MVGQRFTYPRRSDMALRRAETIGRIWAWLAGAAVLAFVAFIVVAGVLHSRHTTGDNTTAVTTGAPNATTGSGSSSPRPLPPASNKSGMQ